MVYACMHLPVCLFTILSVFLRGKAACNNKKKWSFQWSFGSAVICDAKYTGVCLSSSYSLIGERRHTMGISKIDRMWMCTSGCVYRRAKTVCCGQFLFFASLNVTWLQLLNCSLLVSYWFLCLIYASFIVYAFFCAFWVEKRGR